MSPGELNKIIDSIIQVRFRLGNFKPLIAVRYVKRPFNIPGMRGFNFKRYSF